VVAERDEVRPRGEHAVGELGRDADAVGEVLAVEDADVGLELAAQPAQSLLDDLAAWASDDVADEENAESQGSEPAPG
jgi:hypothetical protein